MNKSIYFAFVILFLFSLTACDKQNNAITPSPAYETGAIFTACPDVQPTLMPKPSFLKMVFPVGSITKTEYDKSLAGSYFRGIKMEVVASGIDESVLKSKDIEYRINTMSNRISLFVDGLTIPNDSSAFMDELLDVGPFLFSWAVRLENGRHEAKLVFYTELGEIVEYLWSFCIVP